MKSEKTFLQKASDIFFPSDRINKMAIREVIPFFTLVTMAVVWMYVVYVRQIESWIASVVFTFLMLLHLGLYWAVFRFIHNNRSLRLYFIFQGLLALVIVQFAADYGLAIGLYASLIGNSVGSLQQSRDLFLFIPGYILLAILAIVIQSGTEILAAWSIVAIPSILLSGFIAFMFRRQLNLRENAEKLLADLRLANTQLETYAEQVEELTLNQERQRIARELHDTLAQELTGMVLQLEAVSTHIEKKNPQRAQEILQAAMQQSRSTLAEARKVIDNLRGLQAGDSLADSVQREADNFESVTQIPCGTTIQINSALSVETRIHLIKITSEGLNNIAKHARASQVWVRLSETEAGVRLEIEDNGQGFEPAKESGKRGHYGLIGIRERVEILHGQMSIDSQPGKGTCMTIEIPLAKKRTGDDS